MQVEQGSGTTHRGPRTERPIPIVKVTSSPTALTKAVTEANGEAARTTRRDAAAAVV